MMEGDAVMSWPRVRWLPVVGPLTQTLRNVTLFHFAAGVLKLASVFKASMLFHTANKVKSSPLISHEVQAGQLHKTKASACY